MRDGLCTTVPGGSLEFFFPLETRRVAVLPGDVAFVFGDLRVPACLDVVVGLMEEFLVFGLTDALFSDDRFNFLVTAASCLDSLLLDFLLTALFLEQSGELGSSRLESFVVPFFGLIG